MISEYDAGYLVGMGIGGIITAILGPAPWVLFAGAFVGYLAILFIVKVVFK